MAYDSLKALIRQYIKTNGEQEITGQILQNVLIEMVNQYPSTDGYATQSWVTSQGYLIPGSRISLLGNDVGYLTSADLSGYATISQLAGYLPLTGGTLTGDLNMAAYKLYFGTSYIYQSTIPGPQGSQGHILNFLGVDGYGYYGFDNSVHATSFVKSGGTSAQFLKADGSVDSNTYLIPGSSISLLGNDVGYLTSADLSGYATTSQLAGYLPLTGGTLTGDLNMAAYKLIFGTPYIYGSTIPGPQGTNMGHILNFAGVDGYGYYSFDNSVHATSFIMSGGTSAQFLKADGSVDSNAYITASALSGYATQSWVTTQLGSYNPTTNFKTINNQSIIGTGNINIEGGGGGGAYYDAEIEYLESTGTQWIDTGIRITSSCKIELSVIGKNTTDTAIFGTNNGSVYDKGEAAVTSKENIFIIIYPTSNSSSAYRTLSPYTVGTKNDISYTFSSCTINGNTTTFSAYQSYVSNRTLYIYATNRGSAVGMYSAKLYYFKIYNGTTLVFDAIPVRVGNVGYMYDRVSGQLFGNAGTGNFVLGQDTGPGGGLPYLPLTGGTITGNLTINSGRDDTSLNIYGASANGYGKIYVDGDGFVISGFYTGGNIYLSGNVSVDDDLNVFDVLRVNSDAYARSFIQTSDLRKKTIIGDVPMNLYNVANAPLFKFTWKDEKKYSGQHIGSAAQYWQTVLPELVSIGRDADMTLAMQYDVIALASAITVAKTVVNHEERIILLERENEALRQEIADLKSA